MSCISLGDWKEVGEGYRKLDSGGGVSVFDKKSLENKKTNLNFKCCQDRDTRTSQLLADKNTRWRNEKNQSGNNDHSQRATQPAASLALDVKTSYRDFPMAEQRSAKPLLTFHPDWSIPGLIVLSASFIYKTGNVSSGAHWSWLVNVFPAG